MTLCSRGYSYPGQLLARRLVVEELQNQRDEIAQQYFDALPFELYPVQETALFAWFSCQQGVLMCAPTGTGKTVVAEGGHL